MTRIIRPTLALIWLFLPPLLLSAVIHMADPDIDGWQGLASSSALWSVALVAVLFCPLFLLCLGARLTVGRSGFLVVAGLTSVCLGLVLTILGSGATTIAGRSATFAACTGVVLAVVLTAVVPAAAIGWPRSLSSKHRTHRSVGGELARGDASAAMAAEPPRQGPT